ncbi:MAG: prolipoprotein diacylglyceryl transferase [Bradymonadia bacterium]
MFVWNADPNLFHLPDFLPMIGGRGIRYYGAIYVCVFLGGFWLWKWQMLRGGRSLEQAERFFTMGFLGTIIGSRLGHCLFYEPEVYLKDPIRILYFWQGGLASHGGTIGLICVLVYFANREKMQIREVLDRFSLSAAWGATLIRVGNFMNSEIVGRVADGQSGVKFPRYEYYHNAAARIPCETSCAAAEPNTCSLVNDFCMSLAKVPWRHPSQLYEVVMGTAVFLALWLIDRRFGEKRPIGLMGFSFLLLYFTGRFVVEFYKEFQALGPERSSFTMGQYLSIPFMILGGFGIYYSLKNRVVREPAAE